MQNPTNPPLQVNDVQHPYQNYQSDQPMNVKVVSPEQQAPPQYSYSSQNNQPPINQPIATNVVYPPNSVNVVNGYNKKQSGSLWIACLIYGIWLAASGSYGGDYNSALQGILLILWSFGIHWNQVQDKGDHLLLTWGPLRWCLCGMGKEKIKYRDIKYYAITKTCFYGFGIPCCTALKLFTTCTCGCGQKVVRLTVKETYQGMNANDADNCCLESGCLNTCCAESAESVGSGCCFRSCCNPCNANCCVYNTVNISTDDPEGLMNLLNQKCVHLASVMQEGQNGVQYANL